MKTKWIFQVIEKTCYGDVVWATFSELKKAKQYLEENDFDGSDYFKVLSYKIDSEKCKEITSMEGNYENNNNTYNRKQKNFR